MRVLRVKAYIIDFIILAIALLLIGFIFPKTDYVKQLEHEENGILEDYLGNKIDFNTYVSEYGDLYYQVNREMQLKYVVYFIFMVLYFILLPYVWKGRTIGCYLCNVQVERFDQGRIRIWQLWVRNSFVFGLGYVLLNNIALLILSQNNFFMISSILAIFQFFLAVFSCLTVLIHKEKRGLHELVSNTEITKIIKENE